VSILNGCLCEDFSFIGNFEKTKIGSSNGFPRTAEDFAGTRGHEEMKRILQAREERFQFQEMKWMRAHEQIKRIFQNFIII
jgi:hypothetical protein